MSVGLTKLFVELQQYEWNWYYTLLLFLYHCLCNDLNLLNQNIHLLVDLCSVDFGCYDILPNYIQPVLPNYNLPKPNRADNGTNKIQVNPT